MRFHVIFLGAALLSSAAFAAPIESIDIQKLRGGAAGVYADELREGNEARNMKTLDPLELACIAEQTRLLKGALVSDANRWFFAGKNIETFAVSLRVPRTEAAAIKGRTGLHVNGKHLELIVYHSGSGCQLLTVSDLEREIAQLQTKDAGIRLMFGKTEGIDSAIRDFQFDAAEILKAVKEASKSSAR